MKKGFKAATMLFTYLSDEVKMVLDECTSLQVSQESQAVRVCLRDNKLEGLCLGFGVGLSLLKIMVTASTNEG